MAKPNTSRKVLAPYSAGLVQRWQQHPVVLAESTEWGRRRAATRVENMTPDQRASEAIRVISFGYRLEQMFWPMWDVIFGTAERLIALLDNREPDVVQCPDGPSKSLKSAFPSKAASAN